MESSLHDHADRRCSVGSRGSRGSRDIQLDSTCLSNCLGLIRPARPAWRSHLHHVKERWCTGVCDWL